MDIPRYKNASGTQEELRARWKEFKDPEPVTETYEAPDGTTVSRVLTDVLNADSLSFWTKFNLPPIETSGDNITREYSPVLKSQPSPCSELEYPVDNAGEIGDVLSH